MTCVILPGMLEDAFGSAKNAEYPWQMPIVPLAPAVRLTESERRASQARRSFDF